MRENIAREFVFCDYAGNRFKIVRLMSDLWVCRKHHDHWCTVRTVSLREREEFWKARVEETAEEKGM